MSHQVLARKYRPLRFEQLVGQEHVVQALANGLTQGRLHHAYLFTGTRGVGKTTVSRLLAKSLNCIGLDGQGGVTASPCGVCAVCRDIDSGRFVDYVELDAASNRGVDEISLLLDQAVYKPVIGRFKVYMIDEVHMLTATAFNAMLKTLEEPPDYLKFVLATTDPQKVLPTVLSRCLQFNLRPMAPDTVQQHLAHVLADEQIASDTGSLRLLARAARGSMRDALSLTDQAIAFGAGSLTETGVRQMLGAVDRDHAVRIVEAIAASDGAGLVAAADDLRGLGLSAAGTLEELATLLQQMAVAQVVAGALDETDPQTPTVLRLSTLMAADELQLLYSLCLHGRADLALAPDEYSGLVMALLRMLAFRPEGAPVAPKAERPVEIKAPAPAPVSAAFRAPAPPSVRMHVMPPATPRVVQSVALPVRVDVAPASAPAPAPVAESSTEPPAWFDDVPANDGDSLTESTMPDDSVAVELEIVDIVEIVEIAAPVPVPAPVPGARQPLTTPLGDRWATVVDTMVKAASITALTRELAMQSQCLSTDEKAEPALWRLRVERESLRAQGQRDKLQAALSQTLGRAVRLEVELGVADDSPALRAAVERERRQREAEQIIYDDPLVKTLMAQYKSARIVPGSIKTH